MRLGTGVQIAALAVALAFATGPASADDYQDAVDRTHSEVDEFEVWVKDQIAALKQEIAELRQELDETDSANEERIQGMIEDANKLVEELNAELDEVASASNEHWEEIKARTLSGWHRVQAAYYAALAELRGEE